MDRDKESSLKESFLNDLNERLKSLPDKERLAIIRDLEEHIDETMKAGREEAAILKTLGSPKKIAAIWIAEATLAEIPTKNTWQEKISVLFKVTLPIIAFTPFTIFVTLPCLLVVVFFIVACWFFSLGLLFCSPLVIIASFLMLFLIDFNWIFFLISTFFSLGWLTLIATLLTGTYCLTILTYKTLLFILQRSVHFVKPKYRTSS